MFIVFHTMLMTLALLKGLAACAPSRDGIHDTFFIVVGKPGGTAHRDVLFSRHLQQPSQHHQSHGSSAPPVTKQARAVP